MKEACFKNSSRGFTFAEVLIALGIIGVIAALTVPSFVAKYKLKELETNFKHAYSLLANANLSMSQDYPERFETGFSMDYREQLQLLQKYLPNSSFCNKNYTNCGFKNTKSYTSFDNYDANNCIVTNNKFSLILNNGIIIAMNTWAVNGYCIDTNGPAKGPNKTGYDVFLFAMDKNKGVVPYNRWGGCFNTYGPETAYKGQAGNTCAVQAAANVCPSDSTKTYWECLP